MPKPQQQLKSNAAHQLDDTPVLKRLIDDLLVQVERLDELTYVTENKLNGVAPFERKNPIDSGEMKGPESFVEALDQVIQKLETIGDRADDNVEHLKYIIG